MYVQNADMMNLLMREIFLRNLGGSPFLNLIGRNLWV